MGRRKYHVRVWLVGQKTGKRSLVLDRRVDGPEIQDGVPANSWQFWQFGPRVRLDGTVFKEHHDEVDPRYRATVVLD